MSVITNENFQEVFPIIESVIKSCSFIAIDTELTALVSDESFTPSLFDSVEERYRKQRLTASSIATCQIGLAIFTRDPLFNRYEARTYSFYLCPRSISGNPYEGFHLGKTSIEFLCHHGFDFNLFVRDGISFLNEEQEKQLKDNVNMLYSSMQDSGRSSYDEMSRICSQISNWCANGQNKDTLVINFKPSINPFVNHIFINELRKMFPSMFIDLDGSCLNIRKFDSKSEERHKCQVESRIEEENLLKTMLGFSRVFRCIVEAQKIIVGHNMMIDLLLFYQQFHKPLPAKLTQYKSSLHALFPYIYDTKCIINNEKKNLNEWSNILDGRCLSDIYDSFLDESNIKGIAFMPEIEQVTDENHVVTSNFSPHDAGFDAFATGSVFIKLAHILAISDHGATGRLVERAPTWIEHVKAVEHHLNSINLIRANVHSLNITSKEQTSDRPPWLFVQNKDPNNELFIQNISSLLSKFGTIDIKQVSKDEALIAVNSHVVLRNILHTFKDHEQIKVTTYNAMKHSKCLRVLMWSTFGISSCIAFLFVIKAFRN